MIRWRQIFQLCWDGKGFVIDLMQVPDLMLDTFIGWRNEAVEEENRNMPQK